MIWLAIAVALAGVFYWTFLREDEAPVTLKGVAEKAKNMADVNKDGKVDVKDAMAAVAEVKKEVKKVKKKYGGKVKKTK